MQDRYAILVDGEFLCKELAFKTRATALLKNPPKPGAALPPTSAFRPRKDDIVAYCKTIQTTLEADGYKLLRVFYYDSPPATGTRQNPISKNIIDLGSSDHFKRQTALQQGLEMMPNFAVRRGTVAGLGWTVGREALKDLLKNPRNLAARDLIPEVHQKGVDLRIGLDLAHLSMGRLVQALAVVTGDSDMIPALKFARRNGVRVYLDCAGATRITSALKAHADIIL